MPSPNAPTTALTLPDGMRRRHFVAAIAALGAAPTWADASYPSKPITIVLGNSAGSGGDLLCRVLATGLSASLKQTVVVDNRVGANSMIASMAVVGAKPDGYTLLFGSASSTVINQAVQKQLRFDARTDLVAIAQIGAGGVALVATPDFPASDMKTLISAAKGQPGKFNYATWGIGSQGHLVMEGLEQQSGMRLNHVPYKSITAITQDMQGGTINLGFMDVASAMPLVKQGRLKVLGLTGSLRAPGMPAAPLMSEQGFDFRTDGWYGLFAPKGTPAAVVALLNQEVNRMLASAELRERLLQLNIGNPPVKSSEEFSKTIRDDLQVWEQIARRASIHLD